MKLFDDEKQKRMMLGRRLQRHGREDDIEIKHVYSGDTMQPSSAMLAGHEGRRRTGSTGDFRSPGRSGYDIRTAETRVSRPPPGLEAEAHVSGAASSSSTDEPERSSSRRITKRFSASLRDAVRKKSLPALPPRRKKTPPPRMSEYDDDDHLEDVYGCFNENDAEGTPRTMSVKVGIGFWSEKENSKNSPESRQKKTKVSELTQAAVRGPPPGLLEPRKGSTVRLSPQTFDLKPPPGIMPPPGL